MFCLNDSNNIRHDLKGIIYLLKYMMIVNTCIDKSMCILFNINFTRINDFLLGIIDRSTCNEWNLEYIHYLKFTETIEHKTAM